MKLERGFFLLNILLVLTCTAAQGVAAEQYAYLAGTAVVCAAAWRRHERGRPMQLGNRIATVICLAAFVVMILRSMAPTGRGGLGALDVRVPPIGDFLVTFLCVNLVRRKNPREYFWMYLVSVVLMGTAGMLMPGFGYAFFFLCYALIGLATLGAFHIWCEVQRHPEAAGQVRLRAHSLFALLPLTLALMLPVAGIFVLLPRRVGASVITAQLIYLNVQPMVGFSTTVRLGQIGDIQGNPQRVMRVTVRDPDGGQVLPYGELLLRGTGLDSYEKNGPVWVWRESESAGEMFEDFERNEDISDIYKESFPGFFAPGYRRIRCDIAREPLGTNLLFAPFAAERVLLPRRRRLFANFLMHDIVSLSSTQNTSFQYSVISRIFPDGPPSGNLPDMDPAVLMQFLQLPPELSRRVTDLAREVAPDAKYPTDYQKAQAILRYLSDSNRFAYTLEMRPTPGVEPVEDFLFNRHVGHCEYFASAMAVMLRSVGVPARLVNGFKVEEWNPIGEYYIVRQAHAHSWVEAYIRRAGWRTYDPSVMRDAATPQPALVRRWGRNLYDAAEAMWVNYILNFDAANQSGIYQQFNEVIVTLRGLTVVAIMLAGGASLSLGYRQVIHLIQHALEPLQSPLRLVLMLLICYLAVMVGWMLLSAWRRRRIAGGALLFYTRMERALARHGLRRAPAQTPWEFHAAVAQSGWAEMEPVRVITESFCAARYGQRRLGREEMQRVETALRELRAFRRHRKSDAAGVPPATRTG